MYFLPTLLVLFLSTPRPTTAFPFTKSDWDDPASSSLGAQLLYSNNNNNNNNNVLQISGNNQPVNGNPIACKSDSGDSLNFSSIGKRGIEMCPPTRETIPDKKSTPAQPILKDVDRPLRFMSPDSPSPLKTDPLADDDDKCPTRLMKMSKIPVCDSGKLGRDSMRLSGETTYTLFNIRPYSDSDPCLWPCKPWCCVATGTQTHPLFPLDPPVPTGYICRNIDDEIFFQDYDPLAHPQADDPGKWPELPPSQTE